MNKVIISGRLSAEPTVNNGQTPVTRMCVAVDRPKKNADGTWTHEADFLNVVTFNGTATYCGNNLHKGYKVYVEGNIKTGSYTNRDGNKVFTTDVIAEKVELIGVPKSEGGYAPQSNAPAQAVNDPNLPFNGSPQTQPQPSATNGFAPAGNADAVPFNQQAPAQTPPVAPTPAPAPAQPQAQPGYNPYGGAYGGGWNDGSYAPFG